MAQRFNRAMELMGWRVPADDDDFYDDEVEEVQTSRVTLESLPGGNRLPAPVEVVSATDRLTPAQSSLRRIVTLHPDDYSNAREVGEAFRQGTPVIMNLSDLPDAEARRLVDFAAGLVFGLRGNIERVTSRVFLLSPKNVEVATGTRRAGSDF